MSEIKDILFDFIDIWAKENQIYSKLCTVISVDGDKRICKCRPVDGSADILEVSLEASIEINSEKEPINSDSKGFFIVPSVDSLVIVTFTGRENAFISAYTEISDIVIKSTNFTAEQTQFTFNDGSLGGLIKINNQVTKLNNLVTELQAELAKIATGISGAGGAYTPGTLSQFNKNDFENDKITHG